MKPPVPVNISSNNNTLDRNPEQRPIRTSLQPRVPPPRATRTSQHAFARGQAIRLHHYIFAAKPRSASVTSFDRATDRIRGRWNLPTLHELLRKSLARLQLRGRSRRSEYLHPKHLQARQQSPSASGTSGPITTKSRLLPLHQCRHRRRRRSTSTASHRASAAIPPLPGAHTNSPSSTQTPKARACSRPPAPITRIFIVSLSTYFPVSTDAPERSAHRQPSRAVPQMPSRILPTLTE